MIPRCSVLLLLACLSAPAVAAEDFTPVYHPEMTVGRATGAIDIDGRVDDPGWAAAGHASNFAEHSPGDQVRPPVETEALMTFDDDNLYVAWICPDDPALIRATMTERDRIWQDDYVILCLDTFGDQVWAYEIAANPFGVQGDLLWSSNAGEDMTYDMVFETAGRITDEGWTVEMRIPFSSLRFPAGDGHAWRVDFWRNHPREVRGQSSWAAYDRDESCWPCNWGTVRGIDGVEAGKGFELLPSVVATQSGGRVRDADGVPGKEWENGDISDGDFFGGVSLGAKYDVSSAFTLEGTYNPDFSQVESDAAQIDVNSTFALFYPERRPFFQEGSDLFQTWFNAVYTRSVNDPVFAAKLTGRPGRTNVAYLVARDDHTPMILPFEEGSEIVENGRSTSNILRVRHAVGDGSHVGAITTLRNLDGGGSGAVVGADSRIRFNRNLQLEMQGLATRTEEPTDPDLAPWLEDATFDGGRHTRALDGETYWGHALYTSLEYNDRHLGLDVDYWDRSPTFRTDNGFEPANDSREVVASGGPLFRFDDSTWLDWIQPYVNAGRKWNYRRVKKDEWLWAGLSFRFKKAQTYAQISGLRSNELFHDIQFDGITAQELYVESVPTSWLRVSVDAQSGKRIARGALVMGDEKRVSASARIKPIDRVVIEPTFNWIRSDDAATGEELFAGYIARARVQLQVSRELAARVVLQYNDFAEVWEADPLLTYRLNPFSIFYVGSTRDYFLARPEANGYEGWKLLDRQYFMKLQYLFQM